MSKKTIKLPTPKEKKYLVLRGIGSGDGRHEAGETVTEAELLKHFSIFAITHWAKGNVLEGVT